MPADATSIHALNAAAFETDAEARLVDALRAHDRLHLSLVAVEDTALVGHIAFSPVSITRHEGGVVEGIGLGPVVRSRPIVSPLGQRIQLPVELVERDGGRAGGREITRRRTESTAALTAYPTPPGARPFSLSRVHRR